MTAVVPPRARRALDLAELTELVRSYAEHPDRWQPAVRIPEAGEDRYWTRLDGPYGPDGTDRAGTAGAHGADVWLLSWRPGHSTDLHDHGESAAAFAVVRGELTEVRVAPDGATTHHTRRTGGTTWVAPGVIHDVHGDGDGPAVSIHAYSPPLTRMTYYTRTPHGVRPVDTVATQDPEQGPRR